MGFAELKAKQSVMWGTGPYERLPEHYEPLLDHLIAALGPKPGESFLDVATGTGAVAMRAARSGADVTGVDLAPALISTARRLAAADDLAIRFEVGDAEALPYEDGAFDVVASSLGVIFAPDHRAIARSLARVCRVGGRLGLACWSADRGVVDMFKAMAPFQPALPAGVGSPFAWGRPEYVQDLLGDAFELEFEAGDAPQRGSSGEEVWQLFSTVYGPTRMLAESLDPARREALHDAFVDFFEQHRNSDGIHQSRPYLIVLGRRV